MRLILSLVLAFGLLPNTAKAYSSKQVRQSLPENTKKISVAGNGIDGAKVTIVKSAQISTPQIEIVIVADTEENARFLESSLALEDENGEVTIGSRLSLYSCQISMFNGNITFIKGGCFFKTTVFLPTNSTVEVYSDGALKTERVKGMPNSELIALIDEASFSEEKLKLVDEYLNSYKGRGTPSLSAQELGHIIEEISMSTEQMIAFKKLAPFVSDKSNLPEAIEESFSFNSDKKDALSFLISGAR